MKVFAIDFAKRRYFRKKFLRNEGICDRFYEMKVFAIDFAKRRYFQKKFLRNEGILLSILRNEGIAKRRYLRSILRNEGICDRFCEKKIFVKEVFAK